MVIIGLAALWALSYSFYKSEIDNGGNVEWLSWKDVFIAWLPVMVIGCVMGIMGFLNKKD